jgi:hypothetical protein
MYRPLVAVLLALGIVHPTFGYTFYSYAGGKKFAVTVPDEAVKKAPAWKDDSDDPPLSARRALKAADAVKDRLLGDAKTGYKLDGLTLEPYPLSKEGSGWIWVANYRSTAGSAGVIPFLRLAILMDGTVVEPVVTKDRVTEPGK